MKTFMNKIEKEKLLDWESIKKTIVQNLILLQKEFPKKVNIISAYYNYFLDQKFSNETQVLNNFIWFLDMHFINQITDQLEYIKLQNKIFASSLYGRDRNDDNMNELYQIWDIFVSESFTSILDYKKLQPLHTHTKYKFHYLSNISQHSFISSEYIIFWNILEIFVLKNDITQEEWEQIHQYELPKNYLIIARQKVWENLWKQIYLSNNSEQCLSKKYSELFSLLNTYENTKNPLQFPDIQNVIRSRLKQWLSLYGRPLSNIKWTKIKKYTQTKIWDILQNTSSKRSKKTLHLKTYITTENEILIFQGHISHYEKFFYDEIMWIPEIFLTNSWVWANNTVLSILEKYVPDLNKWYEHDFYRENVWSIKWQTILTNQTEVFLAWPSILHPYSGLTNEFFQVDLNQKLLKFIENAYDNPNKTLFLVIDITTYLNLDLNTFLWKEIPNNLVIIKTYSLTKHQRWDTNYFLWGIALYGKEHISFWDEIQSTLSWKWYDITSDQIIAYPRLRHSEIEKNIENINANRTAFKMWFIEWIQEKKMITLMPELIDSEYFTFILIPLPKILNFIEQGTISKLPITDINNGAIELVKRGKIFDKHPIWKWEVIPSFIYVNYLDTLNITLKDTFWLRDNNLSSTFISYTKLFFWEINSDYKNMEIPRIAFWFKKDEDWSYEIWKTLSDMYQSYICNTLESMEEKNITKKTDE